jgi:ribonuclease HI
MLDLLGLDTKKKLSSNLPAVSIWTFGSYDKNTGQGGWGAVLENGSKKLEINGNITEEIHSAESTEIKAAIEAISRLKKSAFINVYSANGSFVNSGNEMTMVSSLDIERYASKKKSSSSWVKLYNICFHNSYNHIIEFHCESRDESRNSKRAKIIARKWKDEQ